MSMDISEDPEVNLTIPLKSVVEEYCCPICFNLIKECFMTPCGHNFCESCIKECLNRKHACPCCNRETQVNQLVKNHHHDRLVLIIVKEKEESSKRYFENLINANAPKNNKETKETNSSSVSNNSHKLSPIEQVFHKYVKNSLLSYEDYFHELEKKYNSKCEETKKHYISKMTAINQNNGNNNNIIQTASRDIEIAKLTAESESKLRELEISFNESVQLLVLSFEKYLQEIIPSTKMGKFIPVTVIVTIPSKNIQFRNIIIKPTETVKDLKKSIEKRLQDTNHPLASETDPLEHVTLSIVKQFATEGSMEKAGVTMANETTPIVIAYQIENGDTVVVEGDFKLKSEIPKQCFSAIFEKGKEYKMDYFTCKDCKFNWICKSCAEECHKGHNIVDYILGHHPNWACCYCVKNKKCKIAKK